MAKFTFQKATKEQAKLRLALIGPAGSGKTYSALNVAKHLGKKIAVVDTEHGSASKYADLFEFDTLLLESFHPRNYVEAIKAAEEAGYDLLIIDSLSHAWIGKDGGLELHDRAVERQKTKNSYTAWAEVTPHHNALVEALVQSKLHLIATLRSKTEYVQEKDERTGRTTVRKVGMAPVMRDGIEYEMDVTGDLDTENRFVVSKTRCPALSGAAILKPGKELADTLLAWLTSGEPRKPEPPKTESPKPIAKSANVPANGLELQRRLYEYDAKLAKQGIITQGALIKHVVEQGVKAGYEPDMATWNGDAILFAADMTKEFEQEARKNKSKGAA